MHTTRGNTEKGSPSVSADSYGDHSNKGIHIWGAGGGMWEDATRPKAHGTRGEPRCSWQLLLALSDE